MWWWNSNVYLQYLDLCICICVFVYVYICVFVFSSSIPGLGWVVAVKHECSIKSLNQNLSSPNPPQPHSYYLFFPRHYHHKKEQHSSAQSIQEKSILLSRKRKRMAGRSNINIITILTIITNIITIKKTAESFMVTRRFWRGPQKTLHLLANCWAL